MEGPETSGTIAATMGHTLNEENCGTPENTGVAGGVRTLGHRNHNPVGMLRDASESNKNAGLKLGVMCPDTPKYLTTGTILGTKTVQMEGQQWPIFY